MPSTLTVVGVSHARTCAAVRERLQLAPDRAAALARSLAGAHEAVVLSTCNRTELYVTGTDLVDAERRAIGALAEIAAGNEVPRSRFAYADELAARHLFRVCAGLDSMVLGDTHVASQVRQAHRTAKAAGATALLLDRLFEAAATASKRIRSETSVSSGQTSIAAVAIAAASRMAGPLSECRLLVIGAGAIAQAAALHAAQRGFHDIVVASRDLSRAQALADRVGGRATFLAMVDEEITRADVIISATAAPGFVLSARHAARIRARRDRSLLIFDLALPRDVDPVLRNSPRLRLVDLDDLARVLATNGSRREADVERAEVIAREEAQRYETWRRSRTAVPAIIALRDKAEDARHAVLTRHHATLAKLAPTERKLVEKITSQLVAKVLHEPTVELRRLTLERGA